MDGGFPLGRVAGFPLTVALERTGHPVVVHLESGRHPAGDRAGPSVERLLAGRDRWCRRTARVAACPRTDACDRRPTRGRQGVGHEAVAVRGHRPPRRRGEDAWSGVPHRGVGSGDEPRACGDLRRRRRGPACRRDRGCRGRRHLVAGRNQLDTGAIQPSTRCAAGWWPDTARLPMAPPRGRRTRRCRRGAGRTRRRLRIDRAGAVGVPGGLAGRRCVDGVHRLVPVDRRP